MRGVVRKTLKTSTIQADIVYLDPTDNTHKISALPPLTVNGKVTAKNAPALVRENTSGLPADVTILIKNITETDATYEMETTAFIKASTIVTK